MGGCYAANRPSELAENVQYPRHLRIKIVPANASGRVTGVDRVDVILTEPSVMLTERAEIGGVEVAISACVLPGLDPHNDVTKECQDGVLVLSSPGQLLTVLFDGHGKCGLSVVSFCQSFIQSHFLSHLQDYANNTAGTMEQVCEECDRKVKEEVDCSVSGT